MLIISLTNEGDVAHIFDVQVGKKPVDVSDQWIVNKLMVEDKTGRTIAGFHVGQDVTDKVAAAKGAAEDVCEEDLSDRFLGDGK